MNRIRRTLTALATLAGALLAFTAGDLDGVRRRGGGERVGGADPPGPVEAEEVTFGQLGG